MTTSDARGRIGRTTSPNDRTRRFGGWILVLVVLAARAQARPVSSPSAILAAPVRIGLDTAAGKGSDTDEQVTVVGKRSPFQKAPSTDYRDDRAPWENKAIRDTMTGANTAAFGNAYNLGSLLGSDEKGDETGGPFVAPHHP